MGIDFTLELQSNAPVYFSGQQIQGHLRAVVSSGLECRRITLTLKGKGDVRWTESRNKSSRTYSNRELYTELMAVVWNGEATRNHLEPGNHLFPFAFVLEPRLPSSYEGDHGSVKYYLKASADIPWGLDVTEKFHFVVHNIFDLNLDPRANIPGRLTGNDTAGCCCCEIGPVSFDMSLPRSGYVPGEVMYISGTISNESFNSVEYTEAKLVQRVRYVATAKTREVDTTVQRVYRPSIRAGKKDVWRRVPLPIPAVTPSGLEYCNIINIGYVLSILAKFGCCKKAEVLTEIIIGSVALLPSHPGGAAPEVGFHAEMERPTLPMPSAPMAHNYIVNDDPPAYPESEPPPYSKLLEKGFDPSRSEYAPKNY